MPVKILIADDEASLRLLVTATLEDEGYELIETRDGATALDLARRHRPDMALLDVQMPGLDGLAVCRSIKDDPTLHGTFVVLLTSKAQAVDRERGLAAGADAYLTKPFSPLELMQLVEQHAPVQPEA